MTSTRAALANQDERGLLDELKEGASDALDFFTGVSQEDVAAGRVDLDKLSRENKIQLLIDGETSSGLIGGSPWSVGLTVNESVSQEIHANKGGTLAFQIGAGFIDAAQSKVRTVRYALVWDDSIVAETGNLDISALGATFLIVGLKDEPTGRVLTLWLTDNDLQVRLVKQGTLQDLGAVRKEIFGEVGAAADKDENPITAAFNQIGSIITTSQIGGLVVLGLAAVVLIVLIRSEIAKDVAKVAAKAVK